MKLIEELRALTASLNQAGVEYALCGGLAMAVYDFPRATLDIDLLVEAGSLEHIRGIAAKHGFTLEAMPMEFKGGKVHIHRLSKIESVSNEVLVLDLILVTEATREAWESRCSVDWDGGPLKVVSPKGLIALKELRNSGQDREDLKYLRSIGDED